MRLPFREPLLPDNLFGHLAATGVPGVEEWRDGAYRRTMRLPGGPGIVALRPAPSDIAASLTLTDARDCDEAVARCRRLLDLDADPTAIDAALGEDGVLGPLVRAAPGRRVPRTVDEAELALRAVLGQQVSTAAARTHAGRIVGAIGEEISDPAGGLTHLFPTPDAVAHSDPSQLALPHSRRRTLLELASSLATGQVDLGPGADRDAARAGLIALPGIGPWTVETIAMRALGDPDAFLATDLGIRAAALALGLPTAARALLERSRGWQPWRAYAIQHLWAVLPHPINHLPTVS